MEEYDPTQIHVIAAGHIVTGFAENSIVSAERLEDKVELHTGAQGEQTFVINANNGGEMTISLKHSSPSIQKLKDLYNTKSVFPINVVDTNFAGEVSAGGSEAMISDPGAFERGGDVSDKEITLLIKDYDEAFNI